MASVKEFVAKAFSATLGTNLFKGISQFIGSATMLKIYQTTGPNKIEIRCRNTADSSYQLLRIDASTVQLYSSGSLVAAVSSSGFAIFGNTITVNTSKTPASATDTGTAGQICWDADYVYVCVATNTWKRSAISTW